MNILGIDWGEHDSAASLLQDGRLVAAAEWERVNRIKHAPLAFPLRAARYCLEAGGITPSDVDMVALSFSPSARRAAHTWRDTGNFTAAAISLLWTRTGLHRRVFGVK